MDCVLSHFQLFFQDSRVSGEPESSTVRECQIISSSESISESSDDLSSKSESSGSSPLSHPSVPLTQKKHPVPATLVYTPLTMFLHSN